MDFRTGWFGQFPNSGVQNERQYIDVWPLNSRILLASEERYSSLPTIEGMGGEPIETEWAVLDPWWESLVDGPVVIRTGSDLSPLLHEWGKEMWPDLDPWWESCSQTGSMRLAEPRSAGIHSDWGMIEWQDLDAWWQCYAGQLHERVSELHARLNELSEEWEASESRFDRDPLLADWKRKASVGPIRTNREENWSQWLAHLLRLSTGEFLRELFGDRFDTQPSSVHREVYLRDSDHRDRRADILVEFDKFGVSIEVKINDENYEKTAHTTGLIEQRDHREWTHVLLLPKSQQPNLQATFGDQLIDRESSRPVIRSDHAPNISVLFWEDVSRAVRRTLLNNDESDPHWEASAYLFVTLIEQKILRFRPVIAQERPDASIGPVRAPELWVMKAVTIENQLEYLGQLLEELRHE